MGNGKVYAFNRIKQCVVTVSSEDSRKGKQHLRTFDPGVVWLSGSGGEQYIRFSFPKIVNIKSIILLNHNLAAGDQLLFEGSTDNSQTVDPAISLSIVNAVDETLVNMGVAEQKSKAYAVFDWNYQYYQLRLQKTDGANIQAGGAFITSYVYEFDTNFQWNIAHTPYTERTSHQSPSSGFVHRETKYHSNHYRCDFFSFSGAQKTEFERFLQSDYLCFQPFGDSGPLYYGFFGNTELVQKYLDRFGPVPLQWTEIP